MFEYKDFRANVLENLSLSVFNKALCELLHDQKFFNGIGNYLRAEIIYRLVNLLVGNSKNNKLLV